MWSALVKGFWEKSFNFFSAGVLRNFSPKCEKIKIPRVAPGHARLKRKKAPEGAFLAFGGYCARAKYALRFSTVLTTLPASISWVSRAEIF